MSLSEEFDQFAESVGLNKLGVSEGQKMDMRRAFYGGQISFFIWMAENKGSGMTVQEQAEAIMSRKNEIGEFFLRKFGTNK